MVILITGTSRGIGNALAKHYLMDNIVIGCSRTPAPDLEKFPNYKHYVLDVTRHTDVSRLFQEVSTYCGRLDCLINNAGIAAMNHTLLTPVETMHKILNTNYIGTFMFSQLAAKLMIKNRFGRIINFSTVALPMVLAGEAAYSASKAAIVSLTKTMAHELGPLGVTVNAIGPTPIPTDLISKVPKQKIDSVLERQAIHRLGSFGDVINVIDFFIRPESDFITGQVIYLGGT